MIELVRDFGHYNELEKTIKKSNQLSNCYLFPEEIERYCQKGQLFFQKDNSSIIFYNKEVDFTALYFFVSRAAIERITFSIPEFFLGKPVIAGDNF